MGESPWPPRRRGAAPAHPHPLRHCYTSPVAQLPQCSPPVPDSEANRGGSPALFDIVKHAPPWRAATAAAARSPYSAACLRRRRGLDVGVDVHLELGEVGVEHVDQGARLGVVGGLVGPGVARVEDRRVTPGQRSRHLEAEQRVGAHRLRWPARRESAASSDARACAAMRHAPAGAVARRRSSRC